MKLATWNVERLKHAAALPQILLECNKGEDILVLTETDEMIAPDYKHCFRTGCLQALDPKMYAASENRVSIFTDYGCVGEYDTFDKYASVCVELVTERGSLLVYGTVIGAFGNRNESFAADLHGVVEDIGRLAGKGLPICVIGDYNLSFADNYYFTKAGRDSLLDSFRRNNLSLLTAGVAECIDHIAVTEGFCGGNGAVITEWNRDKLFSDHKGIMVEI